MAIQENQTIYTFPRIPISFVTPEGSPELGRISNISIVPDIDEYHFNREELEIRGRYLITVSYFKSVPEFVPRTLQCDFFGNMSVCSEGLLVDSEEGSPEIGCNEKRELYSVQFSRSIHTYIDLEFIDKPRSFKPSLIVERADLEIAGERQLKGELVLGLANRVRRSSR